MGIFSRFRDIISSNLNAMLDKAEDPEKMIKMMIREMEDTLVELKASCAGAMANRTRLDRGLEQCRQRIRNWEAKAQLAIEKGREDLAREALTEKRRFREEVDNLEREEGELAKLVEQYRSDIDQLEEKLETARNKRRLLVQRHVHARKRHQAQANIRQVETSDAFLRFEQFENKIDRLEADADLVNAGRKPPLDDAFKNLEKDEDIEKELAELKNKVSQKTRIPE